MLSLKSLKWLFLFTFIKASFSPHFLNDTSFQGWGWEEMKLKKKKKEPTLEEFAAPRSLIHPGFLHSFIHSVNIYCILLCFLLSHFVQFIPQITGLYNLIFIKHHHSPGTLLNTWGSWYVFTSTIQRFLHMEKLRIRKEWKLDQFNA